MSRFKHLLPQSGPPKVSLSGVDWMPKFREQREFYRETMQERRAEKGLRAVKTGGKPFGGRLHVERRGEE